MLVEKYKPKKVNEIIGQKKAVDIFLKWIRNWKPGKKALLFHGKTGTGKTSLVQAYALENNLDFIEMNASDFRTSEQIQQNLGNSIKQQSLFKKGKIFLIDEIDGLAGREDIGGVKEIIKIIKESYYPIILTANDPWDPKLRSLRTYCQLVQFDKINVWAIYKKLDEISRKENLQIDQDVIRQIAKTSEGDLRSAINDLEILAAGKTKINSENLESVGFREKETNIFEMLKIVFKTNKIEIAVDAIQNVSKDPEEILLWIEQNILNEYEKPEEIIKAFEALSRADLFLGRTKKRQNWKYMKYTIDLMTGGVALSKKQIYSKFSRYQYPDIIKNLGKSKAIRNKQKEELLELSKRLHCSTKKIREFYLPYFKLQDNSNNFHK